MMDGTLTLFHFLSKGVSSNTAEMNLRLEQVECVSPENGLKGTRYSVPIAVSARNRRNDMYLAPKPS